MKRRAGRPRRVPEPEPDDVLLDLDALDLEPEALDAGVRDAYEEWLDRGEE